MPNGVKMPIKRLLKDYGVTIILFANMSFFVTVGFFNTLFPIYGKIMLGYSISIISLLFAVRGGSNIIMRMPGGAMSDKIGRIQILTIAYSLSIISFILLSFTSGLYIVALAFSLYGMAWGIQHPVSTAIIGDRVPQNLLLLAMAIFFNSTFIGIFTGSLMAGITGSRYSWLTIVGSLIFLMIFSTLLVVMIFAKKVRAPSY